jgi:hypothetical protein
VDDFESVKTTAWEGVRNHQAKNYMKDMKCGDKASGHKSLPLLVLMSGASTSPRFCSTIQIVKHQASMHHAKLEGDGF